MSRKSQLRIIILGTLLLAAGLVIALVGCDGGVPEILPGATATPAPVVKITPTAVKLTREGELLAEEQSNNSQTVASIDQCVEVFKTETGCNIVQSVRQITRPEWEQLFPDTRFYLGNYTRITASSDEPERHLHFLIVEQDGQRYYPETYDHLMAANHVELTAENRELVARGWALMTIGRFLNDEVEFTSWEPNSKPFNAYEDAYDLKGWARFGGLEMAWTFEFGDRGYRFIAIGPTVLNSFAGDYSGTPFDVIPPQLSALSFFPVK